MTEHEHNYFIFLALVALGGIAIIYISLWLSGKNYTKKSVDDEQKAVPKRDDHETGFQHISAIELPAALSQNKSVILLPESVVAADTAPSLPSVQPTVSPQPMIETEDLKKTYTSRTKGKTTVVEAVKGITFRVEQGEIFGLLGPNGAGKTTTMRMLSTLLIPTAGTARIGGMDLTAHQGMDQKNIRRILGYVSQVGGMQREASGRENLMLQAKLYGMTPLEAHMRVEELLDLLELRTYADRKTGTYSGGQRRIFDLASGIVHRPQLLFLDEPSTGLDPQNRVHVWEQVKKLKAEGTTIVVTTHYLEEADALCDRVAIIDRGTIVAIGTPDELKRQIAGDIVSLTFASTALVDRARSVLEGSPFINDIQINDTTLHLSVDNGSENLSTIITALHQQDIASTSIALARPTLDDVFLKLTGRSLRE